MTNKELQDALSKYPDGMEVRIYGGGFGDYIKFAQADECVIEYSDTAYVDDEAQEEDWDTEEGKFYFGDGERWLLIGAPVQ